MKRFSSALLFLMTVTLFLPSIADSHEDSEPVNFQCTIESRLILGYWHHTFMAPISPRLVKQIYQPNEIYQNSLVVEVIFSGGDFIKPEKMSTVGQVMIREPDFGKGLFIQSAASIVTNKRKPDNIEVTKCYMP